MSVVIPRPRDGRSSRSAVRAVAACTLVALVGLSRGGCASAPGQRAPRDPLESINRKTYAFNDTLDRHVLKPVAKAYNDTVPEGVRRGVSNVFGNLGEPIVVANDILQLKIRQAAQDTARFLMNSTFGLLGWVDFVGRRGLPKHDEDLGQTLGYWGIGPGPYLVLPFLGPSTVRDGIGMFGDHRLSVYELLDNDTAYYGTYVVDAVHTRADLLGASNVLEAAALDRYTFLRDAYLQRRLNQVYDGHPPKSKDDELDDEPDAKPSGDKGAAPATDDAPKDANR